jgi:hypothetical protein
VERREFCWTAGMRATCGRFHRLAIVSRLLAQLASSRRAAGHTVLAAPPALPPGSAGQLDLAAQRGTLDAFPVDHSSRSAASDNRVPVETPPVRRIATRVALGDLGAASCTAVAVVRAAAGSTQFGRRLAAMLLLELVTFFRLSRRDLGALEFTAQELGRHARLLAA